MYSEMRGHLDGDKGRLCSSLRVCVSSCSGGGRGWFGLRHWEVDLRRWGSHRVVVVHNYENARM